MLNRHRRVGQPFRYICHLANEIALHILELIILNLISKKINKNNSKVFWLDADKHNLGGGGYTISKII